MVLGLPQLDRRYYVESDASDTAIGAVLSQVRRNWQGRQFNDWELPPKSALQPVAFFSKRLSKMERNYSAREQELLGGIASMTHFCCYIDGAPGGFTWITDHKGIVYFCTQRELTPHEYCYLDRIEQYDPHIIYRKGEENIVADALSRRPGLADNDEPSNDLKQVLVTRRRPALIGPPGPTTLERLTADVSDGELAIKPGMAEAVTESIACEGHSTWLSIEQKALSIAETAVRNSVSAEEALPSVDMGGLDDGNVAKALQKAEHWVLQLFVEDGCLFCLNKLGSRVTVITSFERACSLTKALHNEGGHRKQSALKNLVTDRYTFPAMLAICGAVAHLCIECQIAANPGRSYGPLHPLPRMDAFERWGLDFLSLPGLRLGNTKLITVIGYCTGQAHAFPTKNENTADALRMMENLIHRYGKPSSVICDNGSAWISFGFCDYMCSLGIRIIYISPYHPQTNGKVERFNGILLNALKSEMTSESPFFMMYGRHPRFWFQATDNASDALNTSRNHELEAQLVRARHFDKFRTAANIRARQIMERRALLRERSHPDWPEIAVGDIILARNRLERAGKYDPPWSSPYLVSSISVEGVAKLVSRQGRTLKSTINVLDLKLAHGPSADRSHWFPRPPPQQSSFISEADLHDDNASSKQLDPPAESPAHSQSNDDDSGSRGKGKQRARSPNTDPERLPSSSRNTAQAQLHLLTPNCRGFARSKSYHQFESSDSGLIPIQEDDWDASLAAVMQVSHLQQELFDREGDGNNGDPGPSTHATAEPLDPTCYSCGEPGHALRDCPALSTSASRTAAWKAPVLEPSKHPGTNLLIRREEIDRVMQSAAYKAYNKMWKRLRVTCTYRRQYQEELKQLNFLTGGAVWQDRNQQFKARFTPEAYREYKLAVAHRHRATKTVEELQARRRRYHIREQEARASDPDHYKALGKEKWQCLLEQQKADEELNEKIKMRARANSRCYQKRHKEELRARKQAKYQEQKKDPAFLERRRQMEHEWHRKKVEAAGKTYRPIARTKAKALSEPPPLAPSTLPSPDCSGSDTRSSDEREPPPSQQTAAPSSNLSNIPNSKNDEDDDSDHDTTPFWRTRRCCKC
ncbi:hypothetical protein NDA11_005817 [Ustilago hordei]|nr:hypothetical protein NDA11_005817 [Ustilago hordei]